MSATKHTDNNYYSEQPHPLAGIFQSPIGHVVVLGLCIFFVEGMVMIIIHFLRPLPVWVEILFDPVLLIIVLTPMLYLLVVRPLTHQITICKEATEALKKIEERLSMIFNAMPDPVTVTRLRDGLFLYVNPAFTNKLKYASDEALGKTIFGLNLWANPEDREILVKRLEEAGTVSDFEAELYTKDGVPFLGSASASVIEMEGEKCMVLVTRDITETKRANQELTESERRFRETLTGLNMIAVQLDRDGNITFVNDYLLNLSGWDKKEIIGKNWINIFIADEIQEEIKQLHNKYILNGKIETHFENEIELRNGEKRIINWNNSRLLDINGNIIGVTSIGEDITERRRAEIKLEKSEEMLSKVFHATPEGVAITRLRDGMFLYANPGLAKLAKCPVDMILGKTALDLKLWSSLEKRKELVARLEEEGEVGNFEIEIRAVDGETTLVSVSSSLVEIEGEKCMVSLTRDIVEQKRAENALQTIAEGVSGSIGNTFFDSLVNYLAEILEAEYAFVGELIPENKERVKTIAVHGHGNIIENFEYDLASTPCENVVGNRFCFYEKDLQKLFPNDQLLIDMDAESYAGSPIFDSNDQPLGIIAVLSSRPFKHRDLAETLLRILVLRCANELERKYSEDELRELYKLSQQKEEALRESETKLRSLAAEMTIAEEQERRRIAVDMHDHFIQDLGLSKIKLGMLAKRLSENECFPLVEEARDLIELLIKEARLLVFEMSVPILYELGLEAAIKWLAEETAKKSNFSCEVYDDGQSKPLKKEMQVILFKAVRELMTNIGKHAQAEEVNIFIDREIENIVVCVQDDGVGFTSANIDLYHDDTKSFGLFGIRERIGLMNGSVAINSTPGKGTSITLTAPLEI